MNPSNRNPRSFSTEQLRTALGDVVGPARPDYLTDIVAQAGRIRQRPAWTFTERWLSVSIEPRSQGVPRSAVLYAVMFLLVALLAAGVVLIGSQRTQPERLPGPEGIFAGIGGWIAYGNGSGIWAIDPAGSGDRDGRVQLSAKTGTPRAWSPDGSKLLFFLREGADSFDLFVLNADGTETRLATAAGRSGAGFTPDGSQVVYGDDSNTYVIDAEGGTPELLFAGDPEGVLSPDGTQIAYLDWGRGDSEHSLRVINSDGTGTRVVTEDPRIMGPGHLRGPGVDWSPDGQHLVFATEYFGVWVVGIDGSGLVQVSPAGSDPHWSPDGSLISYNTGGLVIVRADGTRVQRFDSGRSGPWNPR